MTSYSLCICIALIESMFELRFKSHAALLKLRTMKILKFSLKIKKKYCTDDRRVEKTMSDIVITRQRCVALSN